MFGAIECLNDIQHKCKSISDRDELGVNATNVHARMGGGAPSPPLLSPPAALYGGVAKV